MCGGSYLVDMFGPPKFMLYFYICLVLYYLLSLVVCYVWKKAHGKRENRQMETNVANEVNE